jgi:hypothetical protein
MTTARGLHTQQPKVCFSVTKLQRLVLKPSPPVTVGSGMKDDADTLCARLYRLAELVELARQLPSEDRARARGEPTVLLDHTPQNLDLVASFTELLLQALDRLLQIEDIVLQQRNALGQLALAVAGRRPEDLGDDFVCGLAVSHGAQAFDHSGTFYQWPHTVAGERTRARAMGMSDNTADQLEDKRAFLCHLIDHGYLEHGRSDDRVAIGITRQVIDRGEASLSSGQTFLFKREVLDVFVTATCKGCGSNVPWSEMYSAFLSGGYCARCSHNLYR